MLAGCVTPATDYGAKQPLATKFIVLKSDGGPKFYQILPPSSYNYSSYKDCLVYGCKTSSPFDLSQPVDTVTGAVERYTVGRYVIRYKCDDRYKELPVEFSASKTALEVSLDCES